MKAYEAIVKGNNIPEPGVPESFKVLIKELQSIGLDIRVLSADSNEIFIRDEDDDDAIKKNANELEIDVGNFADHDALAAGEPDEKISDDVHDGELSDEEFDARLQNLEQVENFSNSDLDDTDNDRLNNDSYSNDFQDFKHFNDNRD